MEVNLEDRDAQTRKACQFHQALSLCYRAITANRGELKALARIDAVLTHNFISASISIAMIVVISAG